MTDSLQPCKSAVGIRRVAALFNKPLTTAFHPRSAPNSPSDKKEPKAGSKNSPGKPKRASVTASTLFENDNSTTTKSKSQSLANSPPSSGNSAPASKPCKTPSRRTNNNHSTFLFSKPGVPWGLCKKKDFVLKEHPYFKKHTDPTTALQSGMRGASRLQSSIDVLG